MERIRARQTITEIPSPASEKIGELTDSLPASLKDLTPEKKIAVLNSAYNNIVRTKNLIQEGMIVYPGTNYAKSDGVFEGMMLGDTFEELRAGLDTIGQLENTIGKFRTKKDKRTGEALIRDLHTKIFGGDESRINNYDLGHLSDANKKKINNLLGADRRGCYSGQLGFKPNLSTNEYFYTKLLPFGIVMRETTTYIQQVFPENEEENARAAEVLKTTTIDKLPDRPTEAASTIIYKKLIQARRRS